MSAVLSTPTTSAPPIAAGQRLLSPNADVSRLDHDLLQRYTAARPWDGLLVLQYKDDAALGQREKVVAQVRQELQNDAKWKALADSKQSIRTEKEAIANWFPRASDGLVCRGGPAEAGV